MAKKHKVLVALTGQRYIFSRTAFSLINAALKADYEFVYHQEMGCEIASMRNRIAKKALEINATHLLFVDYDMYFSPEAIDALLRHDKDIVGATYNFRSEKLKSTAVPLEAEGQVHPDELPKELFKCAAIGTGLLLIKTEVFRKMPAPWFMFGYTESGDLLYGEDTFFAQMAIKADFDVYADPTLNVKHVGEAMY